MNWLFTVTVPNKFCLFSSSLVESVPYFHLQIGACVIGMLPQVNGALTNYIRYKGPQALVFVYEGLAV